MNPWQQILLSQASSALHAVFLAFGSKYFTTAEQAAVNTVIDALIDLPRRIHAGGPPATLTLETIPAKRGRKKKVALNNPCILYPSGGYLSCPTPKWPAVEHLGGGGWQRV